jgi:hypothetical protein
LYCDVCWAFWGLWLCCSLPNDVLQISRLHFRMREICWQWCLLSFFYLMLYQLQACRQPPLKSNRLWCHELIRLGFSSLKFCRFCLYKQRIILHCGFHTDVTAGVIFFRSNNFFIRSENSGLTVLDCEVEMNVIYFRMHELRLFSEQPHCGVCRRAGICLLVRLN